jgi:hypothetical protein
MSYSRHGCLDVLRMAAVVGTVHISQLGSVQHRFR